MAQATPRFTVSLDRLDGGEPIEDREVRDVQLREGIATIFDGPTHLFTGDAWSWLEVRRIDETADASIVVKPAPSERQPTRPTRQARSSK
jgi:hypothetical protein